MDKIVIHMQPRYKRQGQCNRCGACCVNEDCEHLEMSNGASTCLIHNDPDRPLKCKLFPEMPPILFPNCGYYFLDKYEDNRVVKIGEV